MQLAKKVYIGLQPLGKRSSFEKKNRCYTVIVEQGVV